MPMRSTTEGRGDAAMVIVLVMLMLTAWMVITDRSEVASAPEPQAVERADLLSDRLWLEISEAPGGNIYAKYDGVSGESDDSSHPEWIGVMSMEWGVESDRGGATGPTRRRGSPTISDLILTFNYEKSVPQLVDKLLKGELIPLLEIEFTNSFGETDATYLRYELKNVALTNYGISGLAGHGPPGVSFFNNFEEIKVIYTEYDDKGSPVGTVEYEYKVEKG